MSRSQMEALHADCDADGDGELTLEEFTDTLAEVYREQNPQEFEQKAKSKSKSKGKGKPKAEAKPKAKAKEKAKAKGQAKADGKGKRRPPQEEDEKEDEEDDSSEDEMTNDDLLKEFPAESRLSRLSSSRSKDRRRKDLSPDSPDSPDLPSRGLGTRAKGKSFRRSDIRLTAHEMSVLRKAFRMRMQDDVPELRRMSSAGGRSRSEGRPGEPEISREAFMELLREILPVLLPSLKTYPSDKDLKKVFRQADEDQSGMISEDELLTIFRKIKAGEVRGRERPGQGKRAALMALAAAAN